MHLKDFRGGVHADAGACRRAGLRPDPWAGFNELFAGNRITEAACWAHVRRKFFDVHAATASPIAKEALDRITQLYGIRSTLTRRYQRCAARASAEPESPPLEQPY
jgi:transposase